MLDIQPFSFLGDWYSTGKMQKWMRLIASVAVAAFIGFFGGMGVAGSATLAATKSASVALATGWFIGCILMAGSVAMSVKKSGMWKELLIVLPPQLETILEQTDVTK